MEQEDRDLLIEVKTEMKAANKRLEKIETKLDTRPCAANSEKLRMHDKFIWIALIAAVGSFIKSIWGLIVGGGPPA